jgi:hypothetical protein
MTEFLNTVWEVPRHMRGVVQSTFTLSSDTFDNASPWTGERSNPFDPFVQIFSAEIKPAPAKSERMALDGDPTWREWQGFITRLRGTSGRMRIVDYFRMRPRYEERNLPVQTNWADGSRWADGTQWSTGALPPFITFDQAAIAGDTTAVVRGLPASLEEILAPADLFEARPNGIATEYGNLYEIVHCARSNADGKARIYFAPGLRQGFAAGDMLVLRYPTCVFRLASKSEGMVTRVRGNIGNLGFKLIEETRSV